MRKNLKKFVLLGFPIDNITMDEALDNIIAMTDQYRKDQKCRLVATANVDFIVNSHDKSKSETSKTLRSILRNADMVTADGMPLVWLSRMLGQPLPGRVTGADMVPALGEVAEKNGKSIYFLGGQPGSAKGTAKILAEKHPDLKIAGTNAPIIDLENIEQNEALINEINSTNPDILLIALGNPKQELWFNQYRKYLKVPVSIGVGGTFEFITGTTSRAPKWAQKIGVEWIYRIMQDPHRLLKRYLVGLRIFSSMVIPLLAMHWSSKIMNYFTPVDAPKDSISRTSYKISSDKNEMVFDFNQKNSFSPELCYQFMNTLQKSKSCGLSVKLINQPSKFNWWTKAYRISDLIPEPSNLSETRIS